MDSHRDLLLPHLFESQEFLWHENGNIDTSVWALAVKDDVTEDALRPYAMITFPGGIFLVATCDESDAADLEETVSCMMDWIRSSTVFEYGGFPQSGMCNMPNPDGRIDRALGISQQQIFLPLRFAQSSD